MAGSTGTSIQCAHAMNTRLTKTRTKTVVRTMRILDQGHQTPKHKIGDARVRAANERMDRRGSAASQKYERGCSESSARLRHGAINNSRGGIQGALLDSSARITCK